MRSGWVTPIVLGLLLAGLPPGVTMAGEDPAPMRPDSTARLALVLEKFGTVSGRSPWRAVATRIVAAYSGSASLASARAVQESLRAGRGAGASRLQEDRADTWTKYSVRRQLRLPVRFGPRIPPPRPRFLPWAFVSESFASSHWNRWPSFPDDGFMTLLVSFSGARQHHRRW
jgi:hypothetical protein